MPVVLQSVANCSGPIHHAKLPFGHKGTRINNYNAISVTSRRILRSAGIQCLPVRWVGTTYTFSVGKDHPQLSFDDEVPQEPFLLSLFKETCSVVFEIIICSSARAAQSAEVHRMARLP